MDKEKLVAAIKLLQIALNDMREQERLKLINSNKKISKIKKFTYYLPNSIEEMVIDIYIKRMKTPRKSTKSEIICDAIRLLSLSE